MAESEAELTERRSGYDRRSKPTPIVSAFSFRNGKRRHVRRASDRSIHVFVDRYSPWIFASCLALLVLSLTDAYCTLVLVDSKRCVEANPIMAFYLNLGDRTFITMKVFFTAVGICVFFLCKNYTTASIALLSSIVLYVLIIMYELYLLC